MQLMNKIKYTFTIYTFLPNYIFSCILLQNLWKVYNIVNNLIPLPTKYFYQISIFTQPLRSGRIWHKVNFFQQSLTGLNSEFSFSKTSCLTKAEEHSLPYYLPIAGRRIIGFIPFPRVLVLCEMQSASSRIWTRVAVSISYDDNHYTTGTSLPLARMHFYAYGNNITRFDLILKIYWRIRLCQVISYNKTL